MGFFFALQKGGIFRTSTLLLLRSTGYEFRQTCNTTHTRHNPYKGEQLQHRRLSFQITLDKQEMKLPKRCLIFTQYYFLPFVSKHVLNKIRNRSLMQFNYQWNPERQGRDFHIAYGPFFLLEAEQEALLSLLRDDYQQEHELRTTRGTHCLWEHEVDLGHWGKRRVSRTKACL